MSINFLGEDNKIIRIEDHLPFDLKQDPCHIAAEDFGLFYTDAMDNMNRYNGKRVSLIGQAVILREFNGRAFVLLLRIQVQLPCRTVAQGNGPGQIFRRR